MERDMWTLKKVEQKSQNLSMFIYINIDEVSKRWGVIVGISSLHKYS